MQSAETIVIGGGPAGAAAAARLVDAGREVLVLDRAPFPRLKLCAGWITPEVVDDLGLDLARYPHSVLSFDTIVAHVRGLTFNMPGPQHSIRRVEFDDFLLRRSGAEVRTHQAREIVAEADGYRIDDSFRCRYLVGAGGTRCPVHRGLFRERNPRDKALQAGTLELEFPYPWRDPRCHLWFFDGGLPGYAWYVPKAGGVLNLGLGAMAQPLARGQGDLRGHWRRFIETLRRRDLYDGPDPEPSGYSYFLRGRVDAVRRDNAFLTGDSAGLATRDLCEGIGPAIRSGQRAAASILSGAPYILDDIGAYSSRHFLVRKLFEYLFVQRGRRRHPQRPLAAPTPS
ncbi:MAG: NAD(P)/FAD-dependent oxidoreductase [Gammaproteobacteria bacterium]